MKKTKIIYWIFTGLFAAFMAFSAIPDVLLTDEAVAFMKTLLGLPNYLTQFIGIAKLLGVIAILVPGFPRIKEWAYAGFAFDLTGAVYCVIAAAGMNGGVFFMLVPISLGTVSYIYFHKKQKEAAAAKPV
jgi:DoxX-like protein